jgi:NADPH:quinone reductase-like Zn-dependent oxidoreductase
MSLDQLIPCGEMLLVRRDPPELRCGEILIPGTANLGITTSGKVVRVGPRAEGVFAPGDRVVFGILAGLSLASEGVSSEEEFRLVAAGDIQCRIRRLDTYSYSAHVEITPMRERPSDATA